MRIGKKPLIVIVLLSVLAVGAVAGIYTYYLKTFTHSESVSLTVAGIDAYLVSPLPVEYIALTEIETDLITGKAFIEAPRVLGGPLFEVRDIVLTWDATNLASADVMVTVSGLPEGVTAEIKIGAYAAMNRMDTAWYSATIGNFSTGNNMMTYSNFGDPGLITDIDWSNTKFATLTSGVPITLTSAEFERMQYVDQSVESESLAVPNGMIIHISPMLLGDVLNGGWGDFSADFDISIDVEISGDTE